MNRSFLFGILLANLLLTTSFSILAHLFWIVFPISLTMLMLFSFLYHSFKFEMMTLKALIIAIISGSILYLLFAIGKWLIVALSLPFLEQLRSLYALVQPVEWWHLLCLFLIIIPAEEFFWRGFVLERLRARFSPTLGVFIAAFLYGIAHCFSGSILLVIAGFVAGTVWGALYIRYQNLSIAIVSHLFFDFLLLIVFPLI